MSGQAHSARVIVGSRTLVNIRGVYIEDTFAEAFGMRAARVVVTGASLAWARAAATKLTGFATAAIGCRSARWWAVSATGAFPSWKANAWCRKASACKRRAWPEATS